MAIAEHIICRIDFQILARFLPKTKGKNALFSQGKPFENLSSDKW